VHPDPQNFFYISTTAIQRFQDRILQTKILIKTSFVQTQMRCGKNLVSKNGIPTSVVDPDVFMTGSGSGSDFRKRPVPDPNKFSANFFLNFF
jgi:hypothetical protein